MRGNKIINISWIWVVGMTLSMMWGLSPATAQGEIFKNQFIQFELPENWSCHVVGTEWVCQNEKNPKIRKEAVMVFAAKVAGKLDSISKYETYLNTERNIAALDKTKLTAKSLYVRKRSIGGHKWVDSMKKNSEIPGFMTRYLATTYKGIAILFTYSVLEPRSRVYASLFSRVVDSLQPRRELSSRGDKKDKGPITSISVADLLEPSAPKKPAEKGSVGLDVSQSAPPQDDEEGGSMLLWIILLAGVLGAYFVISKRKKPAQTEEDEDEDEDEDEE